MSDNREYKSEYVLCMCCGKTIEREDAKYVPNHRGGLMAVCDECYDAEEDFRE